MGGLLSGRFVHTAIRVRRAVDLSGHDQVASHSLDSEVLAVL